MRVMERFEELALDGPALITIGTFDGVHRGHRFLLEQAARRAVEHGYGLLIVNFDPCPAVVLRPGLGRYQLTSAAQKIALLGALQPAGIAMLPFTHELARLSADAFMDRLEARVQVREMWLGEDFGFGRDRSGGLAMLIERGRSSGFALHVVARRMEDSASISSSRARAALAAGDVVGVQPLLGRPFAVELPEPHAAAPRDGHRAASYAIAEHLALPADGSYVVLLHADATGPVPAVAAISLAAARDPLIVWPAPAAAGRAVEFIGPLTAAAGEPLLEQARRLVLDWERPTYEASGNY